MTLGGEMAAYFGDLLTIGFFSAPVIKIFFLYFITLGVGFFSKMSFDGMMLLLGIATMISGTWFLSNPVMLILFLIVGGIVIALAVMRLIRH